MAALSPSETYKSPERFLGLPVADKSQIKRHQPSDSLRVPSGREKISPWVKGGVFSPPLEKKFMPTESRMRQGGSQRGFRESLAILPQNLPESPLARLYHQAGPACPEDWTASCSEVTKKQKPIPDEGDGSSFGKL